MPTYPAVSFFAFDWGPAINMQEPISLVIGAKGFALRKFSKDHLPPEVVLHGSPRALILSLSSRDRASDIPLLESTRNRNIPCVVVCETHHTWARPDLKEMIDHCRVVVAAPCEVEEALQFGFAEAVYIACPPGWQTYPHIQSAAIERQDSEKLIFVSGVKDAADTDLILTWCADAINRLPFKCKLVVSTHPSEDPATKDQSRRKNILARLDRSELHQGNGEALQTACDMVISPGASSASVVAAFQRRPCVCPMNDHFIRINEEKQFGRPYFFPVDPKVGACALCSPETLGSTILALLTDEVAAAALRARQETAYHLPSKVPSANLIAEHIINKWL